MMVEDIGLKIRVEMYKKYSDLLVNNAPRSEYDIEIPKIYYDNIDTFNNAVLEGNEPIDININKLFYKYLVNEMSLEKLVLEYYEYNTQIMRKSYASLILRDKSFFDNFIELGSYNNYNNNGKSVDENKTNVMKALGLTIDEALKTDFNINIEPTFYHTVGYLTL